MTDDTPAPDAAATPEHPPAGPDHAAPAAALPGPEEHAALPEHPGHEPPEPAAGQTPAPAAEESREEADEEPIDPTDVDTEEPEVAAVAQEQPEPAAATPSPAAAAAEPAAESPKKWYVIKVQSGREESIKAAIERKVKVEALDEFFGQIKIPVEEVVEKKKVRVTDKKTGEKVTQEKNVVKYRKKYPGYLFAEVEFNDRILYLFRETSGVGDFVGASHHRAPAPMPEYEVRAMLTGVPEPGQKRGPGTKVKVKLDFEKGDKVRIRDGPFANMEGEVKQITEPKDATETPKVTVEVSIFGRPVPVELDYWHVDKV